MKHALCAWIKLPLGQFVSYCEIRHTIVGASLSELHTSGTALHITHMDVYDAACLQLLNMNPTLNCKIRIFKCLYVMCNSKETMMNLDVLR